VNLLGFLGVYGKTKDTREAQEDQQRRKDPKKLHERVKGRHYSSYALTKAEKEILPPLPVENTYQASVLLITSTPL
jgi:hypothetical protein